MNKKLRFCALASIVWVMFTIASCSGSTTAQDQPQENGLEGAASISETQAIDIAWEALEPNTSSHERSNWQVVEVQLVSGGSKAERFKGEPAPGCWSGPEPGENQEISPIKSYWYVYMTPTPATPGDSKSPPSPTAPPNIPEPFLREAYFLIDPGSGEITARKLNCIIY